MVGPISLTFAHLPFFVAFFTFVICHGKSTLRFVLNLKLAICKLGWSTPIFCRFSNQQQKALSVLLLHPACSLSTLTISTGKYLLSIFMKILVVNFPEWYSWKFSSSLPWQFWSDGAESEQTTYLGDGHQIVSPSFLFIYFWFFTLTWARSAVEVTFSFFMLICIFWCVRPKNGGRRASVAVSLVTTDHPPLADSAEDRVISLTTLYLIKKFYSWNLASTEHKGKGRSTKYPVQIHWDVWILGEELLFGVKN